MARLATSMTSHLWKQGELLAYDLCREGRTARAATDGLWMQRTSTIMEGGSLCDFRVYTA